MVIGINARLLFTSHLEGVARYVFETTCEMAKQHPDDTFILYFDRPVKSKFSYPENVIFKFIYLPTRHPVLWKIWFDWLLPIKLKLNNVDVFYSGDGFASTRIKIPQVMVTHDLAYLRYPEQISNVILSHYRKNIPQYHKIASSIIAVSHFTKSDIISSFSIAPEKIRVAYNAVLPNLAEESGLSSSFREKISSSSPYFCYIGALHPRKNIVSMCNSFVRFKEETGHPSKLLIAGRLAWKTKEIEEAIEKHKDIVYLGPITEDEKYHLLKKSISLVYISHFEGFGIPILEAMQTGTGVITSSVTSMPEVAGDAALLVNPLNENEIAAGFAKMLDEPYRQTLISKGKKRVQEFSWKESAEVIYDSILKCYSH